jgi:type IV secretion system protein VirB10
MKDTSRPAEDDAGDGTLTPLAGEAGIPSVGLPPKISVSRRGLLAIGFAVLSLGAVSAVSIQRFASNGKSSDDTSKRAADRPASASIEPRKLDLLRPALASSAPSPASTTRIPAIVPTSGEVEPIRVRRTAAAQTAGAKAALPEDAPALLLASRPAPVHAATEGIVDGDAAASADPLAQTRRNLDAYQRQLQALLDRLTKGSAASASASVSSVSNLAAVDPPTATARSTGSLFGGQLPVSATPRVSAGTLGDRSLTLPKGTSFTCALKTRVISAASGLVGCLIQRNVYSEDGRVLLVERGSHMDGEYRIASIKPGAVRIPVVWTRIRTPQGVTIDIESPGTGPLGESGIDGYVDNRWPDRIGAALLLSLIDDSVQLAIQRESDPGTGGALVLPATTSTGSKLAEKVLDSTINIPPLIYQNQGGIVGIYVARDVEFSTVYELRPTR